MPFDVAISIGALLSSSFAIENGRAVRLGNPYAGPMTTGRYEFGNEQTLLLDYGLQAGGKTPNRIHICAGDQLAPYRSLLRSTSEYEKRMLQLRIKSHPEHGPQFGDAHGAKPPVKPPVEPATEPNTSTQVGTPTEHRVLHLAAILKVHADLARTYLRKSQKDDLTAAVAVTPVLLSLTDRELEQAAAAANLNAIFVIDRAIAAIAGLDLHREGDWSNGGNLPPIFKEAFAGDSNYPVCVDIDGPHVALRLLDYKTPEGDDGQHRSADTYTRPSRHSDRFGFCCKTPFPSEEYGRYTGHYLGSVLGPDPSSSDALKLLRTERAQGILSSLSLKEVAPPLQTLTGWPTSENATVSPIARGNNVPLGSNRSSTWIVVRNQEDKLVGREIKAHCRHELTKRSWGRNLETPVEVSVDEGIIGCARRGTPGDQSNFDKLDWFGRRLVATQSLDDEWLKALKKGEIGYLQPRTWQVEVT